MRKFVTFDVQKGVLQDYDSGRQALEGTKALAKRDRDHAVGWDAPGEVGADVPVTNPETTFANAPMDPYKAMEMAGVRPITSAEVDAMTVDRAWKTIKPYSAGAGYPVFIRREILAPNFKLDKPAGAGEFKALATGLTFLPARQIFTGLQYEKTAIERPGPKLPFKPPTLDGRDWRTLCASSTPECRRTCLVVTGQNTAEAAFKKKARLTEAFLRHPVEFTKLLEQACATWFTARKDVVRFIRLNMLQDMPWEVIFRDPGAPSSWFFDRFQGNWFYDYTKIPNRCGSTPDNYDMTFSYSGTQANAQECLRVLRDGSARVAVVFLYPHGNARTSYIKGYKGLGADPSDPYASYAEIPKEFLGFPVVDGDRHDFRPYDDKGVWVGLHWKPAAGFQGVESRERIKKFVIEADYVGGQWIVAESARHSHVSLLHEQAQRKVRV